MEMLYVSEGLIAFYFILGLFLLILNISIIVRFFNIASDVREMKNVQAGASLEDLDTLIRVMIAIGNKEEAKHYLSVYESKLIATYENDYVSDPRTISQKVKSKIAPLIRLLEEEE